MQKLRKLKTELKIKNGFRINEEYTKREYLVGYLKTLQQNRVLTGATNSLWPPSGNGESNGNTIDWRDKITPI